MQRIGWPAAAVVYTALVVFATWPLAARLSSGVNDFGDPLLNTWALAWIAHALVTAPGRLFDANIFFPERNTLAYSESLLLPALAVAPIIWIGADPILAHNVLLMAGYIGSGVTMFLLVRALTKDPAAALVAGASFALMPERMEQFAKVQLHLLWWWPLAALALHRVMAEPTWRRAALLGGAIAAECYTCLYYGVMGGVLVGVMAAVLWMWPGRRQRVVAAPSRAGVARALAFAAIVAAILALPLAMAYRSAAGVVGERTEDDILHGSAQWSDYRHAPPESWLYGDDARPGENEHRLFPGYAAPALSALALVPPLDVAAAAYAAAGIAGVDLSLGVNGWGYRWLYAHVWPLGAIRVVARFSVVVGFSCAVLAGLGLARARRRFPKAAGAIALAALAMVTLEGRMRPIDLSEIDDRAPAVYGWLAGQPPGAVCEYPVGHLEGRIGPQDPTYMYYSARHWHPLVNGYSGFEPPSYHALVSALEQFPDDASIDFLRSRQVKYLLVHSKFYIQGDYASDVATLRRRADLQFVGTFAWTNHEQSAVFVLR